MMPIYVVEFNDCVRLNMISEFSDALTYKKNQQTSGFIISNLLDCEDKNKR